MTFDEKSKGPRAAIFRRKLIETMLSDHCEVVGYLMPNEWLEVHELTVEGDMVKADVEIKYVEVN